MLHKLVDLNRIVIFMGAMNGEADRADQSFVLTIRINADECWVLAM